jgi:hypothetical protein
MFTTRLKALLLAAAVGLMADGFAAVAQDEKKDDKAEKAKEKAKEKDKKARPAAPSRRTALLVLPVKEQPDAETLASLEKLFGKELKVSAEKDLNVVILQGPDSVARAALVALRKHADAAAIKKSYSGGHAKAEQEIELVRLRKADVAAVAAAIKKHVARAEVTEKAKSRALVIEGDREAVSQATSLARQLDGQQLDYEVYRLAQKE